MITKICGVCHKQFAVANNRVITAKFCSRECMGISRIGTVAWNKGLRKETSSKVMEYTIKANDTRIKRIISGSINPVINLGDYAKLRSDIPWKEREKEWHKLWLKRWIEKNPEKWLAYHRRSRFKAKMKVLRIISGNEIPKCVYCGCDYIGALEINHKGGGGKAEQKKSHATTLYGQILRGERGVADLEVTCRICNSWHYIMIKYGKEISGRWNIIWSNS